MNFKLGFYRTRDGSIVELTRRDMFFRGHRINSTKELHWDTKGNAEFTENLDLMEYLKVKENGTHDGPSIETFLQKK